MFKSLASALLLGAVAAHDAFKSMEQIVRENGYLSEAYTVITEDGYVLSLHRIPGKAGEETETTKPAVLMMHGLDSDMMCWVFNTPENANAFILADAGYDVWMGNNRGNRFSNTHISMNKDQKEFWDYYQEDLGTKDVPAFVDKIKDVTGLNSIGYVGHSQGTTQMFMGASLMPDYWKENINVAVALAPVAKVEHCPLKSLQELSKHINVVQFIIVNVLHMYNMFPPVPKLDHAVNLFCDIYDEACDEVLYWLAYDNEVDNPDRKQMYVSNLPSGQTWRSFDYYAQTMHTGTFRKYDYGRIKNKEKYGTYQPPDIPLENIQIPIGLFSGSIDPLADPEDVAWIAEKLGDQIVYYQERLMDHLTFLIGDDMTWFKEDAVALLDKYNKPQQQKQPSLNLSLLQ